MPLTRAQYRGGINLTDKGLANEGGVADANFVRWWKGLPQTLGGWLKHAPASFIGYPRAAHAYTTLESRPVLAWGTSNRLYAEINGNRLDITPNKIETTVQNIFSSTSGSFIFTVTYPMHGLKVGARVIFSNMQSTVGGRTIEGTFSVYAVPSENTFQIIFNLAATSTQSLGGGYVDFVAPFPGALEVAPPRVIAVAFPTTVAVTNGSNVVTVNLNSHGLVPGQIIVLSSPSSTVGGVVLSGTFTVFDTPTANQFRYLNPTPGTSGQTLTPSFTLTMPGNTAWIDGPNARDWCLANWGENLMALPVGEGLYEFQPEEAYPNVVYNGDFSLPPSGTSADGWAQGTGWVRTAGTLLMTATAGTASNLSQSVDGILEGGRYYEITFTVLTRTAGSLKFRVNAGDTPSVIDVGTASSPIIKAGTYTRTFLCPAVPKDIVFEKDAGFAGTFDNVSLKLMDRAYRLPTAPARADAMFVEPRGVVVLLGATLVNGSYSPMSVRNSALGNNRLWVPDTNNVASEMVLTGSGGQLMAGIATRQQNLIWSDTKVISLMWTGTVGQAFEANALGSDCGLISRHAAVEHNGKVHWMTPTGQFRWFAGIGANNLGVPDVLPCPVQADIFDNLNNTQRLKVQAGVNSEFSELWFMVPDSRDGGNENTRIYTAGLGDWGQDSPLPWMLHRVGRGAWVPSGVFPNPVGFGTDGYVYDHETGYTADGAALSEYIQFAPVDAADGENLVAIGKIEPGFTDQTGNIGITLTGRMSQNGADIAYPQVTATPTSEWLDVRVSARRIAMRLDGLTAGGYWRFGALNWSIAGRGARR